MVLQHMRETFEFELSAFEAMFTERVSSFHTSSLRTILSLITHHKQLPRAIQTERSF